MRRFFGFAWIVALLSGCGASSRDDDVGRNGNSQSTTMEIPSATAPSPSVTNTPVTEPSSPVATTSTLVTQPSAPMIPSAVTPPDMSIPVPPDGVPAAHRPERVACDAVRPDANEGGALPDLSDCTLDSDCTAGIRGRCEDFRGLPQCTYDECQQDDECGGGGPCGCELAFWSDANACLDGNCQLDADCGDGGYCSPSMGTCGDYAGIVGYWCHTATDTCTDDADCADPTQGPGYCMYSSDASQWLCSYSHCVG